MQNHLGRFELKQGDFRTDSIGKGYDIIIAGLTLHHLTWEERETFYPSLYSALNKGGLLITRDIIIDEDRAVRQTQYAYWKKAQWSGGNAY